MRGNTEVLGAPGRHAASLAHTAGVRAGGLMLAGSVAMAAAVASVFAGWSPVVLAAGVAIALAAFTAAQRPSADAGRANAGASAERRVGRIVERWAAKNGVTRVIHGADLGRGGDADHVLIGAFSAVIETKYGRGKIRVQDGRVHVGHKVLPRNPIGQCERQRNLLSELTSSPAVGIVCISEGAGRWARHGNVIVCSARDLPRVLSLIDPAPPRGDRWKAIAPKG